MDAKALGDHATAAQLTDVIDRSNKLRRRIAAWFDIQAAYMPEAAAERAAMVIADISGVAGVSAPNIPLCLPSAIAQRPTPSNPNPPSKTARYLRRYEWKLREGQAYDCLQAIRHNLRLHTHLFLYKKTYSRGVKQNTRSNEAMNSARAKADHAAAKYRRAREALVVLAPGLEANLPLGWARKLKHLTTDDVKGLAQGADEIIESEGRREVSWIWRTAGVLSTDVSAEEMKKDPGLHEGTCCIYAHFFKKNSNKRTKRCELNGAAPVPVQCDGQKKSICSVKKCDAPSSSVCGRLTGGKSAAMVRMWTVNNERGWMHSLQNRPMFG